MRVGPGVLAAVFAMAVGLDQWVKYLVETRLALHEMVDVLPFLALFRTFNTGIAFSMLSWFGDKGLIAVVSPSPPSSSISPGVRTRRRSSPGSASR